MDGWSLLDLLKRDASTRQIPVHVISGRRDDRHLSQRLGAVAALQKPASREDLTEAISRVAGIAARRSRRLLVAGGSEADRAAVAELLGDGDVETVAVGSGADAVAAARRAPFDCLVVAPPLPDLTVAGLVRALHSGEEAPVPIIAYGTLSREEAAELEEAAREVVLKQARSPEQLLDEASLFLHRIESALPEEKRAMLRRAHLPDPVLAGKTALIVDDDVRNAFALTSALERHQMRVLYAESGRAALELVRRRPDVVLMDVMMPDLDGLETTRAMRATAEGARVPIVALTAKAMKGDRERCLEAGASDYIAKPIDTEQLLSLLRVWLYDARREAASGGEEARPRA
jgi:CheY-like chemotaxis protein